MRRTISKACSQAQRVWHVQPCQGAVGSSLLAALAQPSPPPTHTPGTSTATPPCMAGGPARLVRPGDSNGARPRPPGLRGDKGCGPEGARARGPPPPSPLPVLGAESAASLRSFWSTLSASWGVGAMRAAGGSGGVGLSGGGAAGRGSWLVGWLVAWQRRHARAGWASRHAPARLQPHAPHTSCSCDTASTIAAKAMQAQARASPAAATRWHRGSAGSRRRSRCAARLRGQRHQRVAEPGRATQVR
jgi:hypothetical protein